MNTVLMVIIIFSGISDVFVSNITTSMGACKQVAQEAKEKPLGGSRIQVICAPIA